MEKETAKQINIFSPRNGIGPLTSEIRLISNKQQKEQKICSKLNNNFQIIHFEVVFNNIKWIYPGLHRQLIGLVKMRQIKGK